MSLLPAHPLHPYRFVPWPFPEALTALSRGDHGATVK